MLCVLQVNRKINVQNAFKMSGNLNLKSTFNVLLFSSPQVGVSPTVKTGKMIFLYVVYQKNLNIAVIMEYYIFIRSVC